MRLVLSDKIILAIEHQEEMKDMARKGQVLVNELLDLENTTKVIYRVYEKILEENT